MKRKWKWKENEPPKRIRNIAAAEQGPQFQHIYYQLYTYDEIQKIILNLRNHCSSGHNNIPVKFLKPVLDQITSPIVHLINTFVDKEIFPDSWKVVHVCPTPKVDNPVTVKDFWPITILPVLSNLYLKVKLNQSLNHIKTSVVYNPTQSGFCKGHLTTTLLKSRNDIQKALNQTEITISVLINYLGLLTISLSIWDFPLNFSNRTIKIVMSFLTN